MGSTTPTQGFFSSTGVLDPNALKATPTKSDVASEPTPPSQEIADKAAQITDAAVNDIGNKLNVGNSGFDAGVSSVVKSAVTSALQKAADRNGEASSTIAKIPPFVGGTYQNEILAKAKQGTPPPPPSGGTQPPATTTPPVNTAPPTGNNPPKVDPPKDDEDRPSRVKPRRNRDKGDNRNSSGKSERTEQRNAGKKRVSINTSA